MLFWRLPLRQTTISARLKFSYFYHGLLTVQPIRTHYAGPQDRLRIFPLLPVCPPSFALPPRRESSIYPPNGHTLIYGKPIFHNLNMFAEKSRHLLGCSRKLCYSVCVFWHSMCAGEGVRLKRCSILDRMDGRMMTPDEVSSGSLLPRQRPRKTGFATALFGAVARP